MNGFIIFAALVAVAAASGNYYSGKGVVDRDSTGNTVEQMGFDQNYDGLPDKLDTNRDGRPDVGYGYGYGRGAGYGHGFGYGHGYGYNARNVYDRQGKTVPTMGKDQNNDGVADYKDRNRDGKEDKNNYGYGNGYGNYGGYGRYGGYRGYAGY